MAKAPVAGSPVPWNADETRAQTAEDRDHDSKIAALAKQRAIRVLMSDDAGRDWIKGIIAMCGVFGTIVPTEQLEMSYRLGMRNVGLMIYSDLELHAPDMIPSMTRSKEDV